MVLVPKEGLLNALVCVVLTAVCGVAGVGTVGGVGREVVPEDWSFLAFQAVHFLWFLWLDELAVNFGGVT